MSLRRWYQELSPIDRAMLDGAFIAIGSFTVLLAFYFMLTVEHLP